MTGFRVKPFIEWRPNEVGIGFSAAMNRVKLYGVKPGDKSVYKTWMPNMWLHVGPVTLGLGVEFDGDAGF